jgi:hypothetical protein
MKQIDVIEMNYLLNEIKHREGVLTKIIHDKIKVSIYYTIMEWEICVQGPSIRAIRQSMYHQRIYQDLKKSINISKTIKTEVTC